MKPMLPNSINLSDRFSAIQAQNLLKYTAKHCDSVTMTSKKKQRQPHQIR